VTLWDKVSAWFASAAQMIEVFLSKDEQQILALMKPILGAGDASAVQDLITFVSGLLTAIENPGASTLADLETAVLNGLEKAGSELAILARGMGSASLQALIGLVLSRLARA
jgi:hypothetical protein